MLKKLNLKKIIIITSFVVIYNLKIYSQIYNPQQLIPANHWIYDAIYYLQLESKQISLLDNSPISVAEINMFLKSIDFYNLSSSGKDLYYKIQNYLYDSKSLFSFGPVKVNLKLNLSPSFLFKTNSNIDWSFATDYTGEQNGIDSGYGSVSNYMENEFVSPIFSVPISISFDKYAMIYAEPFLGKSYWAMSEPDNISNIPMAGSDMDFLTPRNAFFSGGYTFNWWGINLHIAKEGLEIGRTTTGSVIYNSNFETDAYIQLSFFAPKFKFNIDVVEIQKNKYMYLHQFEFSIFNRIKLGLVEGTLVDGPFEIRFLNPLMIMHSFNAWDEYYTPFEKKVYGEAHISQYLGVTLDIIPFKNARIYSLYAMNELQTITELGSVSSNSIPDSFSFQLGMEYNIPLKNSLNWLSFSIEGVYSSPFMYIKQGADWSLYRERFNMHSYSNIPIRSWIGTPFGPDAIGGKFKITYNHIEKLKIDFGYLFVAHGTNSFNLFDKKIIVYDENGKPVEIYGYYPSVLYRNKKIKSEDAENVGRNHFLTGIILYTNELSLQGKYVINKNIELNSKLSFIFIFNHKNIPNNFEFGVEAFFNVKISFL